MRTLVIEIAGLALTLFTLLDVFYTVLYARAGTSLISSRLGRAIIGLFRRAAGVLPKYRLTLFTYAGPVYLVTLVCLWGGLLWIGFALLYWPLLPTELDTSGKANPASFSTAMSYSGYALSTVGTSDFSPLTPWLRQLTIMESLLGLGIITLTITYFLQIYNALQRRNTLAIALHCATSCTADAARLVAGLGAAGNFEGARGKISEISAQLVDLFESHHFYPSLHVFRFREVHYAMPHVAVLLMDTSSLIHTAIDGEQYATFIRSADVSQFTHGSMYFLHELSDIFLTEGTPDEAGSRPDPATAERWRRRYFAALDVLREEGIAVPKDPAAGAERYMERRKEWDAIPKAFARVSKHTPEEVDPITERV